MRVRPIRYGVGLTSRTLGVKMKPVLVKLEKGSASAGFAETVKSLPSGSTIGGRLYT